MREPVVRTYVPVILRPTLARLNAKMSKYCSNESKMYSECVQKRELETQERECQQSFTALMNCIRKIH